MLDTVFPIWPEDKVDKFGRLVFLTGTLKSDDAPGQQIRRGWHLAVGDSMTLLPVSFHNVKEAIRMRSELAEHGLQVRTTRKLTQTGFINWAVKC
jgi:hypothetical protein